MPLLNTFAKLRRATVNFIVPVLPHGTTRFPLDGFLWNFVFGDFHQDLLSFVKMCQTVGPLHEDLSTFMMVSRLTVAARRNKRSANNNTLHIKYIFAKKKKSCIYEIIIKNVTEPIRPWMIEHNAVRRSFDLPSG